MLVPSSIAIAAPPAAVWHALVDPDASRLWRGAEFVTDWQAGSSLVIRRAFGSKTVEDRGLVTEAAAPLRLSYRFLSSISHLPDRPENYSSVTMTLTPIATGTELAIIHTVPDASGTAEKSATSGLDMSGEKHVAFYWRSTLPLLRDLVEGNPNIALDLARRR